MASIRRLAGAMRPYAWGSRTALAELQGRAVPSRSPEAELWFGAHPSDPAILGDGQPLDRAIDDDPVGMLGNAVIERFGPRLPFLLKVLAIDQPLSLQVHPSGLLAEAGFADEEARGIPRDGEHRIYRDSWPKPELLCALTPVDALCGFRPVEDTVRLLDQFRVSALAALREDLAARGDGALRDAVGRLLTAPADRGAALVDAVVRAAERVASDGGEHAEVANWIGALGARYPADPGVVVALLLHLVRVEPGQAIYVAPGRLHAYLQGTGVEVMASSDNVIRGGLTPKHVDADELLRVLDPTSRPVPWVEPVEVAGGLAYPTSAQQFALQRLEFASPGAAASGASKGPVQVDPQGPEVLLAIGGSATIRGAGKVCELASGEAAFVAAASGPVAVSGPGPVYRVTVGATSPR